MRAAVAAFLAPFLIATSFAQVLAQTGPQGPSVVQSEDLNVPIPVPTGTFRTSERPVLLSWVPSVERNSPAALIWAAGATNSTAASEPLLYAAPARLSTGAKTAIIVGDVILILVIAVAIACSNGGCIDSAWFEN